MAQGENEFLKDCEKRFQLSYKRVNTCTLDLESLKLVLLKGVKEELMETLNLLANGDISKLSYEHVKQFFKR
jgi:hypothetical protein